MKKIIIIFTFVFCGCNKSNVKDNQTIVSTNTVSYYDDKFQDRIKMDSLRNRILNHGDTIAYKNAREIYILSGYRKEFFTYAIIMSSKYKYSQAGADIKFLFNYKTDSLSSETKTFLDSFKKDSIKWSEKAY